MTFLEAYCNVVGWQGGTIHQARRHFSNRSNVEQISIIAAMRLYGVNDAEFWKEILGWPKPKKTPFGPSFRRPRRP